MINRAYKIIWGGLLGVVITFGTISTGFAQNLRLTPPKIDFAQCIKPQEPLNNLAEKLKNIPVSKASINDKNLLSIAALFKDGNAKIIPDISKTVEIIEYLSNKTTIKPLLKARALKMKAQMLYAGEGYIQDKEQAKTILSNVIETMDPTAKLNLAKMLEVEGQFKQAESLYKQALEQKDPVAALALAYMYHNKDIIVPDTTTDSYVILAQNMLLEKLASGQCNYFGKIGFMYLKAVLGSADAMYDLGLNHWKDDKNTALDWFKKSGERHHMQAIEKLIAHYENISFDEYLYWLGKASQYDDVDPKILVEYADALRSKSDNNPRQIFALYEQAGRFGNDEALFQMGEAYKYGIGVEKNPTKALRFYRLAAQNANLDAFESLVESYECGFGKTQNNMIADKWKIRGEYYGLQTLYDDLATDFNNAKNDADKKLIVENAIPHILNIARDKQSARAMIHLGVMYDYLGDNDQSQKWFNRAFSMKNANEAYYHYARVLQNDGITKQDLDKANQYMMKAVSGKNPSALKYVGRTLEKEKKYAEARNYFERAYQNGDESSALKIALMDLKLGNKDRAISYLKKAADKNDAEAMFELAKIYNDTNRELVKKWFVRAQQSYICETDDILKIAEAYLNGDNVISRDVIQAEKWLGRISTIDTLSENEQLNYAELIINSETFKTRPEYKIAINTLENLANQNNTKALFILSDHYLQSPNHSDKAVQWLAQSAQKNNAESMVKLARLYLSGHMVEQSTSMAKSWFEKAAKLGNADAVELLQTIDN